MRILATLAPAIMGCDLRLSPQKVRAAMAVTGQFTVRLTTQYLDEIDQARGRHRRGREARTGAIRIRT